MAGFSIQRDATGVTNIPRDSSGIYSPPAGTAGVPNQPISSTAYNAYVTDNGSEITNSLPVTGVRAMQAPLPMGGNRITALANPTLAQDAVTKNYADTTYGPLSQSTFLGGTSTGTANAQVLASTTPSSFALTTGVRILWSPGFTNTTALTLAVTSPAIPATNVLKASASGPVPLTGGEVVAGEIAEAIYDGTQLILVSNANVETGPVVALASAATTDLGTIGSRNVSITGAVAITSFGSSAAASFPIYYLTFAGSLTLTYNATSLILPGAANIQTLPGDTAVACYLGSGNWCVVSYTPAAGIAVIPTPVPKRQTVLSGPLSAGLPGFLPATSASRTIVTQSVSTTTPLVLAFANGFGAGGAVDIILSITSSLTWTSVTASATVYLGIDYTTGVPTTFFTTLVPIYQYGGTLSITNGQYTFDITQMKMFLGNGSVANPVKAMFLGECVAGTTTITSTVAYAYQRRYRYQDTASLPPTGTSFSQNCNLGIHTTAGSSSAGLMASIGVYLVANSGVGNINNIVYNIQTASSTSASNLIVQTDGMVVNSQTGTTIPFIINGNAVALSAGRYVFDVWTTW